MSKKMILLVFCFFLLSIVGFAQWNEDIGDMIPRYYLTSTGDGYYLLIRLKDGKIRTIGQPSFGYCPSGRTYPGPCDLTIMPTQPLVAVGLYSYGASGAGGSACASLEIVYLDACKKEVIDFLPNTNVLDSKKDVDSACSIILQTFFNPDNPKNVYIALSHRVEDYDTKPCAVVLLDPWRLQWIKVNVEYEINEAINTWRLKGLNSAYSGEELEKICPEENILGFLVDNKFIHYEFNWKEEFEKNKCRLPIIKDKNDNVEESWDMTFDPFLHVGKDICAVYDGKGNIFFVKYTGGEFRVLSSANIKPFKKSFNPRCQKGIFITAPLSCFPAD